MKNVFRMLLSTVAALAILYLLFCARMFYIRESALGDTVDNVILWCFKILGGLTVFLYLRNFVITVVQTIRHSVHRKNDSSANEKS